MPALSIKNGRHAGRRVDVTGPLTLGRENAEVVLDEPLVSRRHASIRPVDQGLEIDDLGSRNGTWVNGARIEGPTRLAAGDVVAIGPVLMVVEWERPGETVVAGSTLAAGATLVREVVPQWQTFSGKGVTVYAQEGSYAARRSTGELRDAQRAVTVLEELLAPPAERRGAHVDIYVVDAPLEDERDGARSSSIDRALAGVAKGAIVRVIEPEAPGEPVAHAVAHLLVERWFGQAPASSELIVRGIAGVVAGKTGAGPQLPEIDVWLRAEMAAGRPVSIVPARPEREGETAGGFDLAAASFIGFLLRVAGQESLRQLVAAYDPQRRDQAFVAAYQRPLGSLEEHWLASLHEVSGVRATFRSLYRHLVPLMKPYWARWLEIFAYMLVGVVYTIAIPLAFKYLFDTVIPDGSVRRLVIFILVVFGIFVTSTLMTMRRSYVTALVNHRVLLGLQERMFERLQQLSHNFYARAKVGDLMSRLSQDLNTVNEATTSVLAEGMYLVLSAIAAAITALVLSPLLGALVLVVVPLFSLSYVMLMSRVRRASHEVQTIYGQVAAMTQENLSAHSLIKAFGLEGRSIGTYRARLGALLRAILRVVWLGAAFEASVGMAVTLGQLVIIGLGGYLVIDGNISLGTLVAFVGLLPTFFQPITSLANVGQQVQRAAGAMDRVLEVLEEPIDVTEKAGAVDLPPLSADIRLENVTFGYEPERPILRNLDMTVAAGSHVAIVGPSGSGKSTVVNLLLRFWDAQEGRVLFDGRDVRDVTLASLRAQTGLVFQDTFVFDTTLRENIALAKESATDDEVLAAAKAARLDAWIDSLPAGPDTILGERGVRMSGGQRQRLAIARALLRNPSILILDEATSALDAKTEAEILDTLGELAAGRTTISITHRLSLAAMSDRIFVLEHGAIIEQGTHASLAAAGGLYQRLYEEQMAFVGAGLAPVGIEVARLHTIPLLSELGPRELTELAERLTAEQLAAGQDVVRQGDEGQKLYLIASGQAEVLVAQDGRERRVNTLNDGDYFGEMALLSDEPRAATVRTTMPTQLYSLSRNDFLALLERDGDARQAVRERVAARHRALVEAASAATRVGPVSAPAPAPSEP